MRDLSLEAENLILEFELFALEFLDLELVEAGMPQLLTDLLLKLLVPPFKGTDVG